MMFADGLGMQLRGAHYKGARAAAMQASLALKGLADMATKDRPVLVYTTFAMLDDAKRVGDALVAARLAACVNIFPRMVSIYEWKGTREVADEIAMFIKTRASLAETVLAETKRLHPYELPALIVLPTVGGSVEYCGWILEQTSDGQPS
jgi:periplasmic divalent cation tolerance protein